MSLSKHLRSSLTPTLVVGSVATVTLLGVLFYSATAQEQPGSKAAAGALRSGKAKGDPKADPKEDPKAEAKAKNDPAPGGDRLKVRIRGDQVEVLGDPTEVEKFKRIIEDLARGSADDGTLEARAYPLKNARADDMAVLLTSLYNPSAQQGGSGRRRSDEPDPAAADGARKPASVKADVRTNTVIVLASHNDHTVIEKLIAALDGKAPPTRFQIKIYALPNHRDLDDLASRVTKLYAKTKPGPEGRETIEIPDDLHVIADPTTHSLVVSTVPERFAEIDQIFAKIELSLEAEVIPLKNAKADEVVAVLKAMFLADEAAAGSGGEARRFSRYDSGGGGRSERSSSGSSGPGSKAPGVKLVADNRTNSIVVTAARETLAVVKRLIAEIDRPDGGLGIKDLDIYVYEAKFMDVDILVDRIQTMMDRISNSSGGAAAGGSDELTKLADSLLGEGGGGPGGKRNGPGPAPAPAAPAGPKLEFSLDYNLTNNEMTVLANKDAMKVIRKLVEKFDVGVGAARTAPGDPPVAGGAGVFVGGADRVAGIDSPMTVRPVFLERRRSQEVADIVRSVYDEIRKQNQSQLAEKQRRPGGLREALPSLRPIKIVPVADTNILIVTAPSDEMYTIESLISKVDKGGPGGVGNFGDNKLVIMPLNNADPDRVADVVEKIINGQRAKAQQGQQPKGGKAAGKGGEKGGKGGKGGGEGAGRGGGGFPGFAGFGGGGGGAEEDAPAGGRAGGFLGRGGTGKAGSAGLKELYKFSELDEFFTEDTEGLKPVRIAVDHRTRSLLIWTHIDQIELIRTLVAHLDDEKAVDSHIAMFQLQRATASQVQRILESLLLQESGGAGRQGAGGRQGGAGAFPGAALRAGGFGGEFGGDLGVLRAQLGAFMDGTDQEAARQPIRITSDERTNSILAAAHPAVLKVIGEIIRKIDKSQSQVVSNLRIVKLKHAQAARVAEILQQSAPRREAGSALPADAGAGGGAFGGGARRPGGAGGPGAAAPASSGGSGGGGTSVTVASDDSRNQLIIRGLPDDLEIIDRLIQALDVPEQWNERIRIYALNHADPAELGGILQELLRQRTRAAAGGAGGAQAAGGGDAVVLPNRNTRTLIVSSGAEDVFDLTQTLIGRLDRPGDDQLHVIQLRRTDARQMATVLESFVKGAARSSAPAGGGGPRGPGGAGGAAALVAATAGGASAGSDSTGMFDPLGIAVDDRTNSLVLSTTRRTYDMVITLIAKLEAQPASLPADRVVEIIRLDNAAADEAAPRLRQMWDAMIKDNGGAAKVKADDLTIYIDTDLRTNSMLMVVPRSEVERIRVLAARIDQAEIDPVVVEVVAVKGVEAASVVATIEAVLSGTTTVAPAGGAVRAGAQPAPGGAAGDQAQLVRAFFAGGGRQGQGAQGQAAAPAAGGGAAAASAMGPGASRPTRLRIPAGDGKGVMELDLRRKVQLTTEAGSNVVVITGTARNVAVVKQWIAQFEKISDSAQQLKLRNFRVNNGDATAVLNQLTGVLKAASDQNAGIRRAGGAAGRALTAPASLAADERNNSILALGTDESLGLLEALIKELDADPRERILVRVIPLKEADPKTVADTLNEVFSRSRRSTGGAPGGGALAAGGRAGGGAATSGAGLQVERLVMHMSRQPGGLPEAVESDTRNPLSAHPAAGPGSIIVTADERNMRIAEEMIKQLDRPAEQGTLRYYPVQFGDAAKMATLLDQLYLNAAKASAGGPGGGAPAVGGAAADRRKPVFTSDPRTNMLIVQGTDAVFRTVEELTARVDIKDPGSVRPLQVIPVQHYTDISQLANILQTAFEAKVARSRGADPKDQQLVAETDRVVIVPEPQSRTLIVSAANDNISLLKDLLGKIDQPVVDPLIGDLRIFPLQRADANKVRTVVQEIFDQQNRLRGAAGTGSTAGGAAGAAQAIPAVAGGAAQRAGGQAGRLGTGAAQAVQAGNNAGGTRMILTVDNRQNGLIVGAPPEVMRVVEHLVSALDREKTKGMTYRIVQLKRAPAADVVRVIEEIERKRATKALTGIASGDLDIQDSFTLVADDRTNSLVIYAHPDAIEDVARMAAQVDDLGVQQRIVAYPLRYASADAIAAAVSDMLARRAAAAAPAAGGAGAGPMGGGAQPAAAGGTAAGGTKQSAVRADARTNQVLVSAPEDEHKHVEEILKALDRPLPEDKQIGVEIVTLAQGRAADVAALINQVYARTGLQAIAGAAGPGGAGAGAAASNTVLTAVDERTNSIIISASRDILPEVIDLTRKLEEGAGDVVQVRIFQLERGDPDQIRTAMLNLLRGSGSTTPAPGGAGGPVLAAAGPGGAGARPAVGGAGGTAPVVQIEFPIPGASPGQPVVRVPIDANKIAMESDKRTNSLIVKAPPLAMPLLEDMIRQMDSTPPQENLVVRVVALENADATATAATIQTVFAQSSTGIRTTPVPGGGGNFGNPGAQAVPAATGGTGAGNQFRPPSEAIIITQTPEDGGQAASLYKTLRVSPDRRTNTLVLVGDKALVERAEDLARQLDTDSSLEVVTFVYPLRNAVANDIAQRLSDVFSHQNRLAGAGSTTGGQGGAGAGANRNGAAGAGNRTTATQRGGSLGGGGNTGGGTGGTGGAGLQATNSSFGQGLANQGDGVSVGTGVGGATGADVPGASIARQLETDVQIASDPATNSVIVSAGRRYAERVRELIRELDRQPPQVMIQALIAEVTVNDNDVFGAQINLTDSNSGSADPAAGAQQFRVVGAPQGMFAGTLFANVSESTGGLTLSGAGNNFNYFIRAMQTQGRLRVLSEPKILAANNQAAHITVGSRVPIVTNTQVTDNGNTINSIQYEQLGIILEVIPYINPEGMIRLEIRQENSNVDKTQGVPISINSTGTATTSPVFTVREAATMVSVKDGETVVIGGMISDETRERTEKVPFLGDLPIIGLAFSGRTQETIKTELILILTPRVVRTVEDARRMTAEQKARYFLMDDKALHFTEFSKRKRTERRYGLPADETKPPADRSPRPEPLPAGARDLGLYGPPMPGRKTEVPAPKDRRDRPEAGEPDPYSVPIKPAAADKSGGR